MQERIRAEGEVVSAGFSGGEMRFYGLVDRAGRFESGESSEEKFRRGRDPGMGEMEDVLGLELREGG